MTELVFTNTSDVSSQFVKILVHGPVCNLQ